MKSQKITLSCIFFFVLMFSTTLTAQKDYKPIVKKSIFFGKSKAIRDVTIVLPGLEKDMKEVKANPFPDYDYDRSQISQERLVPENVQDYLGSIRSKGPILNIEGIENVNGGWPADPNGDVGMEYYIQTVNSSFAVYDKSGDMQYGPVAYKSIFDAFPGPWHQLQWCDPIIIYDQLADRWAFTTMSLKLNDEVYYEMVAVSATSDPLGEYYCYAYQFENVNDYPKMSAWPNGYYITYNIFEYFGDWNFLHSLVTVVDREAMLNGETEATMLQFIIESPAANVHRWSPLTADFNGTLLPDNPECLVVLPEYKQQGFPWEVNINFFEVLPDWMTPENSTFDSINQINVEGIFPTFWYNNAPQPGNFHDVETVNFYLMYPLSYRNFDDYEVMVGCQTLYDGEQHYIRWYEFRNYFGDWLTYQSGNYMPDSASRYMPSISMNGLGDIAMVYTKSSLEIYPSICLTGRKAGDSLGMMTISELEIYKGLNYVNNYSSSSDRNRWGDYASMMVDPVNDSTFWFTSMYPLANTSQGNWSTRIVAMNLTREVDAPYAYAGPDTIICGYESFITEGDASNFSSVLWETDGDGYFPDNTKLLATYIRGNADLENGQANLSLTATGYEQGASVTDSMSLFLNQLPIVNAGLDDTICVQQSFSCQGEVSFSEDYYWTASGNGTFNDSTLLRAIYTPALSDTADEWLILTLHALPIYPCIQEDDDKLILRVESCMGIDEISDRINLKIYPNPSTGLINLDVDNVHSDECLIQVISNSGSLIFSGSFPVQSGHLRKQFDFGMLPRGTYYLKVLNDNNINTIQLIIQ